MAAPFGLEEQRKALIRTAHRACRDSASGVRFVRADNKDEVAATRARVRAIASREVR